MGLYDYVTPDTSNIPLAPRIRTVPEINPTTIKQSFEVWKKHADRMAALYDYYVGVATPSMDPEDDGAHHVLANYCQYIVKTLKGYIIGNAPEYTAREGDTYGQAIIDLFRKQNKTGVDSDLIQDMITYGRAFELVYLDDKGTPKSAVISPKDCYVAYTGTVEEDSVYGAVRYAELQEDGRTKYTLHIYDKMNVSVWQSYNSDPTGTWTPVGEPTPHGLGRVPLIEYRANKEFMSTFEPIISLQNTYNRILLNRVADIDAFTKSVLLIAGAIIGHTPDEIEENRKQINRLKVLQMDEDGQASYLTNHLECGDSQIALDDLKNSIHKFSMVPDLSDEQFSNNSSGVAMAYKLFGTDQIVSEITTNFKLGFARRVKLYDYKLNNPSLTDKYEPLADLDGIKINFRFNTPQDLSYIATPLVSLTSAGIISKDTARRNLSIVEDAKAEGETADREQATSSQIEADAYLKDRFANIDPDDLGATD